MENDDTIPLDEVIVWLNQAVSKKCVQVWLGYADTLFLGFGDEILVPYFSEEQEHPWYPTPEFELQSYLADWILEQNGQVIASSFDDEQAELNARHIVGVQGKPPVTFLNQTDFRIDFENGYQLFIEAYTYDDFSYEGTSGNVWGLRLPDDRYLICDFQGVFRQGLSNVHP